MNTKTAQKNLKDAVLNQYSTIENAVKSLNKSSLRICLVVNHNNQLIGTVSDGDLRRGILKGLSLKDDIKSITKCNPFKVPQSVDKEVVKQIMIANKISQVPEVNDKNEIVYLHRLETFLEERHFENKFVIMAGGKGVRLKPLTDNCPKPMLEINGKPMIRRIIEQAKSDGFIDFIISINYLGNIIEEYLSDGSDLGVNIEYIKETIPLGTAGSLTLLPNALNKPFVVTNGDVISDIQYSDILDFHSRHNSDATMAVRLQERQNPYGVVKMDGVKIISIDEKPKEQFHVIGGIYVISPATIKLLKKNSSCDMPEFFELMNSKNLSTYAYPMHEPWLDVGNPLDFQKANKKI